MSDKRWCAIYISGSNALVSKSANKIQRVLARHPDADFQCFVTEKDGWGWIRCKHLVDAAKAGKKRLQSPSKSRLDPNSPYGVSSNPSQDASSSKSRPASRSTVSDTQMPGAFPWRDNIYPDIKNSDSDSDYGYSDDTFRVDDPLLEVLDHLYSVSPPQTSSPPNDHKPDIYHNHTDAQSTSSCEDNYPLDNLPCGEELALDSGIPTPPSSSPIGFWQPLSSPSKTMFRHPSDSPANHSPEVARASVLREGLRASIDWSPTTSTNATAAVTPAPHCSTSQTPTETLYPTKLSEIELSDEQKAVLRKVLAGSSVFFTGSAGTGKSVLLREIISALRATPGAHVDVTASTGIAALNIAGRTLHSFAGVGLGKQSVKILIKKAMNNDMVRNRWRDANILVVDEISMVDGDWFDKLEAIARAIRENNKPFGGIQLVLCGDFFQLPPVEEQQADVFLPAKPAKFAFEAWSWHSCVPTMVQLTQVFRQKEPRLIKMLNEMRLGRISEETCQLFYRLSRPLTYQDNIEPTELYPKRWSVDTSNKRHLNLIKGDIVTFTATDDFFKDAADQQITPEQGRAILDRMVARSVQLKIGAQVMCTRNLGGAARLVNGSVGKVVDFVIPLDARKSQKYNDNDKPRPHPYTSVTGDLEPDRTLQLHPQEYLPRYPLLDYESTKWPVVEYIGGHRILMGPVEFTSERVTDDKVQASRYQIPLILAWALTIHKSQGQTLERVKVDLRGTFETGQAYVALSRCTSLEGLEVRNFHPGVVMANPKVMRWSGLATSCISGSTRTPPRPAGKPFHQQPGPPENRPDHLSSGYKRGIAQANWSEDDEESIAIQMYYSP